MVATPRSADVQFTSNTISWNVVGNGNTLIDDLSAAFKAWGAVANLNFIFEGTAGAADITFNVPDEPTKTVETRHIDMNSDGLVESAIVDASESHVSDSSAALRMVGEAFAGLTVDPLGISPFETVMSTTSRLKGPGIGDIETVQTLYGTSPKSDLVYLGQPDSVFLAGSGSDTVYGEFGRDEIYGESGEDLIYGNQGLDLLVGGAGNDTLFGGQNEGSGRGDPVALRDGVDTLSGGSGDDLIYGNFGSDLLLGGDGRDVLYGGQDDDTLSGGSGSDYLIGNLGRDYFTGGAGADTFDGAGGGNDVVFDFDPTEGDRLSVADPDSVVWASSAGTVLLVHSGGTVSLIGQASGVSTDGWLI